MGDSDPWGARFRGTSPIRVFLLTGHAIPWYVADFPADRARDTAPAVSRVSLALCAGSRDADLDRDAMATPVALQGRRGPGAERHAAGRAPWRGAPDTGVTPRERCHEMKHPGIDDVQSSSFAGLTAGGVECNSTIPGEGTIPWCVPYFQPHARPDHAGAPDLPA
jgi:hypothetical protein